MLHSTAVVSLLQKIVSIIKIGFADSSGVVCTPLYDALADAEQLFQELTNDNIFKEKSKVNSRKMATKYLLPFELLSLLLLAAFIFTAMVTRKNKN